MFKNQRDTALSTYANRLKEYLQGCNDNVNVSIAYTSVGDEVDRLVSRLGDIPVVVIGRSNQVRLDGSLGNIDRDRIEFVHAKPVDGSATIKVYGRYFVTYNEWQFVVIARNQSDNMAIATNVLVFNNEFYRTYYDSLLEKTDGSKYRVKEIAFIQLKEVREKEFSPSTDTEVALSISATEYEVKEQQFRLVESDVYKYVDDD